nr:MAG TPA: hypothetical protein [Caudoviricetes sp.]
MDASASGLRQLSARARIEILEFFLKKAFNSFFNHSGWLLPRVVPGSDPLRHGLKH